MAEATQPSTTPEPPVASPTATERSMVSNPPGTAPVEPGPTDTTLTPAQNEGAATPAPETPSPDAQPGAGEEATTAPETEGAASPGEETPTGYEQLLPWEKANSYPLELLALAAQKFGVNTENLANDQSLQDMLTSMVTKDVLIRNSAYDAELQAAGTQPEPGDEPSQPATSTPSEEQITQRTQQNVDNSLQLAETQVTPQVAEIYATRMAPITQNLDKAYKSNDKAAIAKAEREYLVTQAAMTNLIVNETVSKAFGPMLEHHLDKMRSSEEQTSSTYAEARTLAAKDPRLGKLVGKLYEDGSFERLMAEHPQIVERQFNGPDGKPLNPVQNAVRQYLFAAQFLQGGNGAAPESLVAATEAGMEAGRTASAGQNRVANAGGFGKGGRSTGRIEQGGDDDQAFMDRLTRADKGHNPMREQAFAKS